MNPTTMSPETKKEARKPRPLNGVDTPTLFATVDTVKGQRELAAFRFRATNRWQQGTHSRSRIESFYGAGAEQKHVRDFTIDADHPEVLVGRDNGALPVEILLVALASCLTAGIGTVAAARGVTLYEVESTIEGAADLQGVLGLSDQVRNGFSGIRIDFKVKGDAPDEKLREIVTQSRNRSAVYDVVTNGTPVTITVNEG